MYLRILNGRWNGAVLALPKGKPCIIGRIESCDLTLAEDMVSRAHASLTTEGKIVRVQDLDSTNGTFLNGRRVSAPIDAWDGDILVVGTSFARIEPGQAPPSTEHVDTWAQNGPPAQGLVAWKVSLDEIPLPNVLRLMQTSKKTGVLRITGPAGEDSIALRKGSIVRVVVGRRERTDLLAATRHLLTRGGEVRLEPPDDSTPAEGTSIEDVLAT